jgi:hypothetical protein
LEESNYTGFIIVTALIVFGVSMWAFRLLWAKKGGRERSNSEDKNKQKAQKMAEEWLKGAGGQAVTRPEEVLDIVQTNGIEDGEGEKMPCCNEATSVYPLLPLWYKIDAAADNPPEDGEGEKTPCCDEAPSVYPLSSIWDMPRRLISASQQLTTHPSKRKGSLR